MQWIQTKPAESFHTHAGNTRSAPISKALPDFEMKMIGCVEVGSLQFLLVENSAQRRMLIHPIAHFDSDVFDMNIHGIKNTAIGQMVLDNYRAIRKFTKDTDNPSITYGIDSFVGGSPQIETRVVVAWLIASPIFSENTHNPFLDHGNTLSVGFAEWREELVADETVLRMIEVFMILVIQILCLRTP